MPGKVIGKKLNYGFEGNVSRSVDAIITNRLSKGIIPFGRPVILNDDGTISPFGTGNTATQFVGISVREVKEAVDRGTSSSGYLDKERTDILNRGYMTVKINHGTPKINGPVYVRIVKNVSVPNGVVGGFEAEADGINTVELTGVRFISKDLGANGVAEITILSRTM